MALVMHYKPKASMVLLDTLIQSVLGRINLDGRWVCRANPLMDRLYIYNSDSQPPSHLPMILKNFSGIYVECVGNFFSGKIWFVVVMWPEIRLGGIYRIYE